jgi:type II secretory pathway component PulC
MRRSILRNGLMAGLLCGFVGIVAHADQNEDLRTTQEGSKRAAESAAKQAPSESVDTVKVENLRSGDVVKSIKGEKVKSPTQAMELYNETRNDDEAVVQRGKTSSCTPIAVPNSDGQSTGLKCFNVSSQSVFGKAGILEGDIVTSVDGQALTAPKSGEILYSKIKTRQYSEIHVIRNGQEIVLR